MRTVRRRLTVLLVLLGLAFTGFVMSAPDGHGEAPTIIAPVDGSTLPCRFLLQWSAAPGHFAVWAGSTPRGTDYVFTGVSGGGLTIDAQLPWDGSTVYFTLWHLPPGGSWTLVDTATYTSCTHAGASYIHTPAPGGIICGSMTVTWVGPLTNEHRIDVGTSAGANDLGTVERAQGFQQARFSGLPVDGTTLHITLLTRPSAGAYQLAHAVTFPTCGDPSLIEIEAPPEGSTIACGAPLQLSWTGPAVGNYVVHIGSGPGAADIVLTSVGRLRNLGVAPGLLPVDGRTLWVRIWHKPPFGSFLIGDEASYTTCGTPATIGISSPTSGSTLPCGGAQLTWTGPDVGTYVVHAGSHPGAADLALQTTLSARALSLAGLPTDGRTVWVRLWYFPPAGSVWQLADTATYTACGSPAPVALVMPAAGSVPTAPCDQVTFGWTGPVVGGYILHVGSAAGRADYALQYAGNGLALTIGGLPQDGSTVHVRLWHKPPAGTWQAMDTTTYTACL